MNIHWLNKNNNKKLIVFLSGWSFDYKPFITLSPTDYDIAFVYDYNNLSIPKDFEQFQNYENKTLISWSMGVFVGYLLRKHFEDFDYKLSINGTLFPVDDKFGIPVKIFELTLKYAKKSLEGQFYKNIFLTEEEYNLYSSYPVQRSIENRTSELANLYNLIKNNKQENCEPFYDFAIVSEFDKIIPPKNQIASLNYCKIPTISLPYGHFLFYNFFSWDEIIQCR